MVGAVIVKSGRLLGEGYHRRFGGPHAEIEAIRNAGGERCCHGATLYVTLEPCCHHGKTPPCTDAVIRAGFGRVVLAMRDPFPKVRGRGIRLLQRAGVRVEVGLLAKEARELNAPYVTLRTKGRPWFIAKWAMSADGKLATRIGDSQWISGQAARRLLHRLRGRVDAVMVGIGTALRDDPLLTCRARPRRSALRIIVDSTARLPLTSQLVRTARQWPVIVACTKAAPRSRISRLEDAGCRILQCRAHSGKVDLRSLARQLGEMELTNVLIEGGGALLGSFLDHRLIDEVMVFVAPKLIGGRDAPTIAGCGVARLSDALSLHSTVLRRFGDDALICGRLA